jgi:TctA family transporter
MEVWAALGQFADPMVIAMLLTGVSLGLVIGVVPGLGGVFGLTILVPLTYPLDPLAATSLLLGMASVTTTSDTIPAVLLGVPGTVGSAATVIDGHEMAKQGAAAKALGAAYTSSMLGGLWGALLLALSIPFMRPLVLMLNFGDLFAISLAGLTLVAMLSGTSQLRGLLAAFLGVLVSLIGLDPYEGAERWTFDNIYFWDGIPTAILFLGLFGLSELADINNRGSVENTVYYPEKGGLRLGMIAALREWKLVLRAGSIGALLGAIPGVGVTVIEWIAYGSVAAGKTGDGPEFGKGNIRGVIAPESANNSKEGGALLPTLAFGIPGSATMAILLGAFAIHGLVPGPKMLTDDMPVLVTMIATIAIANVLATALCLGLTPSLAKIARWPARLLVPCILVFVVLGAFHTNKEVLDLVLLLIFGTIGMTFKKLGWSRPAFALGFVLGPNLERFFVLTHQISGWDFLTQPFVLGIGALVLAGFLRRSGGWRRGRGHKQLSSQGPVIRQDGWLIGALGLVSLTFAVTAIDLPYAARVFPFIASGAATFCVVALLVGKVTMRRRKLQFESKNDFGISAQVHLLTLTCLLILSLLGLGHLWGPLAFVFLVTLLSSKRPATPLMLAVLVAGMSFLLFNVLIHETWPEPYLFSLLGRS